jgi:hypothetical protein
VGRDEAWTGDFEDATADDVSGAGELWNVIDANADRQLTGDAAAHGRLGVRLARAGGDSEDIVLTPLHRLLIQPGDEITVLLSARGTDEAASTLQLSWYNDTIGQSQAQTQLPLPLSTDWQTLRLDTVAPDHAVAVAPYLRLSPPAGNRAWVDLDDVRVIVWHEPTGHPACEWVRYPGGPAPTLRAFATALPGYRFSPTPAWVVAAELSAAPASALPPGPVDSGWGTRE